MKHHHHRFTSPVRAYAAIAAAVLASAGLGALAVHEVRVEAAQARSLVSRSPAAPATPAATDGADRATEVVSLERARLLAPRAEFVRAALAERGVSDAGTRLAHAVSWITPREWSYMATAFGWIAGISLAIAMAGWGAVRWARRLVVACGVAFLLSVGGFMASGTTARALAVVARPSGPLVAPYDGAGATADLPPGVVVVVGPRYGAFVQVQSPDGTLGWVSPGVLESVVGASI